MQFNDKQSTIINKFIMKYNSEEEFRIRVQKLYDEETYKLSILEIYTLEEILRYGTKEIFNQFLKTKGMYTEEQAINSFDNFMKLLNQDEEFKQYKIHQLKYFPKTLSSIERFAFTLISKSKSIRQNFHNQMTDSLEYDSFNPILYSTDNEIRETTENLFFGELIHQMIELPGMEPIKARQKVNGQVSNIDKPSIIEQIQSTIATHGSIGQFKHVIDKRVCQVKFNLLLGKKEEAFEPYLKFNTNISANEILGLEKDDVEEKMYDVIKELVKQKKEQANDPTEPAN